MTFSESDRDLPYNLANNNSGISPSPSVESFHHGPDDRVRYPELYTAATGLGLGLPNERSFSSPDHLSVQQPAYALKERQGYRAGSPVVPIQEKFGAEDPFKSESDNGHSNFGSRAASVRSGRQGTGSASIATRQSNREARERMMEKARRQRKKRLIVIAVVVTIVVLAMVIPVAYVTSRKGDEPEPTATRRPNRGSNNTTSKVPEQSELAKYYAADSVFNPLVSLNSTDVQQGGNGSAVSTYVNGDILEFTYINEFGGTFFHDPTNPFSKGGQAQSWSPAIGEPWVWGQDLVRGVK